MQTKPAYQFDPAGMYAGETVADESPLEPGVFHLPARSTFDAPPDDVPDDKWPRWIGAEWVLANRPAPASEGPTALEKLQAFLARNPDVAAILEPPPPAE